MSFSYDDFTGFSFQPIINGIPQQEIHSSELGIIRTSDGSRYDWNLFPEIKDETASVPGKDGTYWWDSVYTQKNFTFLIAYDSMTEKQRRRLIQIFNGHYLGYLIFDELPFKKYIVKTSGTPNIKYICFEENNQRVYKGEGTLNFISYYPFARSVYKYLDQYTSSRYANKSEWSESSGMKIAQGTYDVPGQSINVFNAGDIKTPVKLYYPIAGNSQLQITFDNVLKLSFSGLTAIGQDTHIVINTDTRLVEGCTYSNQVYTKTGNLYNKYLAVEDFFTIPVGNNDHVIQQNTSGNAACTKIEYDYMYF